MVPMMIWRLFVHRVKHRNEQVNEEDEGEEQVCPKKEWRQKSGACAADPRDEAGVR